jgi:hypothetical protein
MSRDLVQTLEIDYVLNPVWIVYSTDYVALGDAI